MKIALEALGIHDFGGGRTASLNLFRNLAKVGPQHHYLVIVNQLEPSLQVEQLVVPIKNRFLARIWAQLYLPVNLRDYDLVHFVKNLTVFKMPIPIVVTIYDMTTLLYPELFPKIDVCYWQHIQAHSLQQADAIIAISGLTKRDIERCYPIDSNKIKVIYPSVTEDFRPATSAAITRIREKYDLPRNYLLHVGRLDRKNNIPALVEGFAHFQRHLKPDYNGKLIIVGGKYAKSPSTTLHPMIKRLGLQNDIMLTGRVPDEDLPPLYSGAQAAVLSSWHEGFGLVAIEAMACGIPLIAHRTGAIPEVVGDAAFLIDTPDSESIAAALQRVISEPGLRSRLQQRGHQRSRHFQNKQDAQDALKLYQQVIQAK